VEGQGGFSWIWRKWPGEGAQGGGRGCRQIWGASRRKALTGKGVGGTLEGGPGRMQWLAAQLGGSGNTTAAQYRGGSEKGRVSVRLILCWNE
jgi:hypothetical protein